MEKKLKAKGKRVKNPPKKRKANGTPPQKHKPLKKPKDDGDGMFGPRSHQDTNED